MALSRGWTCCLVLVLVVLAAVVTLVALLTRRSPSACSGGFQHAAVAADSGVCSDIARDILHRGGSAVDGAIAGLLCTSAVNPQSMGIGGGVIFTIYNASTGTAEVIKARERAPEKTPADLLKGCRGFMLQTGAQWIGVPGELRGYEEAHKKYGKLPWKSLFEPTIKLVTEGFPVPEILHKILEYHMVKDRLLNSSLCQMFCKDGNILKKGDHLQLSKLGETLRIVAEKGADSFYEGNLARLMVEDLRTQKSFLTLDDFRNYRVERVEALNVSLHDYTLYTAPPPAAGAILTFILNVLKGYNFSSNSLKRDSDKIETFHRIAEAFKFANGQRSKIGHPFGDSWRVLLSDSFADLVRRRIDGSGNHSLSYYNLTQLVGESFGTSHISVMAQDGSMVSATSTINNLFGSMVSSPRTGIIFNNGLADFCKIVRVPGSRIQNGDMPPSTMTPAILISKDKKSRLVIGGSGGDQIISATVLGIMNKLWFGYDLKKAISAPILHVEMDNQIQLDSPVDKVVESGLRGRGHQINNSSFFIDVLQAVLEQDSCIYAESGKKKQGRAAGY
ncbi:glutathione hydrolase 5 proenzyme-like [Microcaecilia unicolor]|uniref:Glutathione hydrolase 5 proenzyme-like n=1 Tax=Microcaecilia unicolor TaxID=1415580 RepID=A0A6P7ZFA4_9AMPH|nr:glutathione hydrolase 5 proenzyme-like [Microcaecilia unicolor]XP_030074265.1 glutathione hydrolase 5 proenzyme-like [Microcaecilia unicolor]